MKVIYVSLIIAALVLSYPGTSQAQKVQKEGTFSLKCSGGNCIGSGIGDCGIASLTTLVVWGSSQLPLPICFTTTNLGKTVIGTRVVGFDGTVEPGTVDPMNSQTICAPNAKTAEVTSTNADCKVIWHVDLIVPAIVAFTQ